MLKKARVILPTVTFIQRDCSKPLLDVGTFELIFSNAFVRWLPNQEDFITNTFYIPHHNTMIAKCTDIIEMWITDYCHEMDNHGKILEFLMALGDIYRDRGETVCFWK